MELRLSRIKPLNSRRRLRGLHDGSAGENRAMRRSGALVRRRVFHRQWASASAGALFVISGPPWWRGGGSGRCRQSMSQTKAMTKTTEQLAPSPLAWRKVPTSLPHRVKQTAALSDWERRAAVANPVEPILSSYRCVPAADQSVRRLLTMAAASRCSGRARRRCIRRGNVVATIRKPLKPRSTPVVFLHRQKLAALPVNRDNEPEGTTAEPSQSNTNLAQGG
jgi:hypothetical protein